MWKKLLGFLQKFVVGKTLDSIKKTDYDWKKSGIKSLRIGAMAVVAYYMAEFGGLDAAWTAPVVMGLKWIQDYLKHAN